jgi:hypothetical protein
VNVYVLLQYLKVNIPYFSDYDLLYYWLNYFE